MAIRYDRDLNREISRVVKQFNQKVRRLEKLDRDLIPDRISIQELKTEFTDRKKLKRELNNLLKFTRRGAEDIIKIGNLRTTKYELERSKKRASVAKRNLTLEIKRIEGGKVGAVINSDYLENLRYRRRYLDKPIETLDPNQLLTREKIITQDFDAGKKARQFYDNFRKMMFTSSYHSTIPNSRFLEMFEKLEQLTPEQLSDAVNTFAVFRNFLDHYMIFTGVADFGNDALEMVERSISNIEEAIPSIIDYYQK